MPAFCRPVAYRIVFERNGQEIDHDTAPTVDRANKAAVLMLNRHADVRDGDRLTITEHQ